ncbi:MAG: hypothetical protein HY343_08670 [Lentisphaerae bacterium]|nr:hypothetical protein [Lentisphaerota bacterium]
MNRNAIQTASILAFLTLAILARAVPYQETITLTAGSGQASGTYTNTKDYVARSIERVAFVGPTNATGAVTAISALGFTNAVATKKLLSDDNIAQLNSNKVVLFKGDHINVNIVDPVTGGVRVVISGNQD